jgi:hypothetical protein
VDLDEPMTPRRRTSVLAWSLFALWALPSVAATWVGIGQPDNGDSSFALFAVGYALVGALVASRQPSNAVGWLLLAIALVIGLGTASDAYVRSLSNPGYVGVAWVSGWLFNVWLYLVVGFLPLVFPTGRLLSPRWRLVWWFELAAMVVGAVVVALTPGHLAVSWPIDNPLGVHGAALTVLEAVDRLTLPAIILTLLFSAASLVLRFRRATGVEHQQLKWFAFAALVTLGGLLVSGAGEALPGRLGEVVGGVGWTIFLAGVVLGLPLATAIAILRYRLYDIDVVINRTLVYGSLTVALAVTYVVSTLLLRALLNPVTGKSDLAVAVSTLAVAALFRPARARIQELVDRRFYRRRYDAVHTLEEFTTRLRHELDLDAVGTDLRTTADRTMQPAHISLWLRAR